MAATNVMQTVSGNRLMIFDEDGNSFAFATNHTLTINGETSDVSTKDHGLYGSAMINKINWEISTENLFPLDADGADSEFSKLMDYMTSRSAVTIYFGLKQETSEDGLIQGKGNIDQDAWKKSTTSFLYKGKVIITSLSLNAPNGEEASYSATLQGIGSLTKQNNG